ncbi:hypothetical protein [Haloferax sp. YSSS75]|uniref:hypothetical protein n=1 Tax=Haloferax sp. YSSS75 TaxID=3388564 RepID=UPI00398D41A3
MRELRSCDFCGTDAVGVFEVLPPELTPADDQRRVVLCDHCRETLTDVIEPLLTRLGVDSQVEVPDDSPAEAGLSAATSGMESDGDAVSVGVDSMDPAPTPPEPADHASPDDDPTDDTADPLDDDAVQAEDGDEADAETEPPEASEPDEPTTADDEDESDTPSEPPQFRKVVRILQNREFPVERADVEALASNAYDLDDEQVAEIFDYAVERGLLVDDDGTLRKP